MSSSETCSSFKLALSEAAPYAVHLRLPASVREVLEKAHRKSLPVSLQFGRAHTDGNLSVGGQDFRFRSQPFTGQNKLVQHPVGDSGSAREVAAIQHKCQVQGVDGVTGGKNKQAARGPKSKTGSALAAKAAAASQQFEEDRRKKAAEKRVQKESAVPGAAGKTTAPEKMKLPFSSSKHSSKAPPAGGTKAASSHHEDRADKDKAAMLVPTSPSKAMVTAAKQDGMRGCIIALMYPPGMKMKNSKLVQRLVKETLVQIGTPDSKLPSPTNILSEFKKLTTYQAPAAYVLKDEFREEHARKLAEAMAPPPAKADIPSNAAPDRGHGSAKPSASGGAADADDNPPPPDRITKRRRLIAPTGKTQVWAPFGDAAHRLAAVPSTAAAERAEREHLEAVMRVREHGASEPPGPAAKPPPGAPHAGDGGTRRKAAPDSGSEAVLADSKMGEADRAPDGPPTSAPPPAPPANGRRDAAVADPEKWFFMEHLRRPPATCPDIASKEEVARREAEFKSKYGVLLKMNKRLSSRKAKVKSLRREGSSGAESRIRQLWREEGEYLTSMHEACKRLSGELAEIKAKVKSFRLKKA